MIRRLRIRMTVVCTLATVLVLVGMALVSLRFAERQFRLQAEAAFQSNLNTVFYYLRGQSAVDQAWLMQTQASEGIYIRIEDSGRPLLYVTQNPEQDMLTQKAQRMAEEAYGFSGEAGAQADYEVQGGVLSRETHVRIQLEQDVIYAGEAAGDVIVQEAQSNSAILLESGFDNAVEQDPQERALTILARQKALQDYGFDGSIGIAGSLEPVTIQFEMESEGARYRAAVSSVPISGGWVGVTILKPMADDEAQIFQLRLAFGGSVLLASLLLLVFAWLFSARAVKPVEESNRKQAEFVSAASHELRSPLAVMQASAGAMQTAPLAKARDFARNIEGECMRLSVLAGDLLALANADSHRWSIKKEEAEPETILLSTGERFEPLAAKKGLTLEVALPDEDSLPRCQCDRGRIEQILTILMDNAVSYTPAGGHIVLSAGSAGRKGVWFSVSDDGPGISDEKKQHIFERFYRGDSARTNREHYGLGLSIAKELAVLHKGTLTVKDSSGGGATFILTIPLS